jgi:hypothetical protein
MTGIGRKVLVPLADVPERRAADEAAKRLNRSTETLLQALANPRLEATLTKIEKSMPKKPTT